MAAPFNANKLIPSNINNGNKWEEGNSVLTYDDTNDMVQGIMYSTDTADSAKSTAATALDKVNSIPTIQVVQTAGQSASAVISQVGVTNMVDEAKNLANTGLAGKVDKVAGYSLISDTEKARLANVTNQTKESIGLGNVPNIDTTAAVANQHTHSNKAVLDNTSESFTVAIKSDITANTSARHTHSNKAILDATTASFTTDEKTKLDGIEQFAQRNNLDFITLNGYRQSSFPTAEGRTTLLYIPEIMVNGYVAPNGEQIRIDIPKTPSDIGAQAALSQTQLDNIADVPNKVDKVSGKSLILDTEIARLANVTNQTVESLGLGTAATKNTGTASGNVPVINASGKLETSILPAIAITDVFEVASQSEMLALSSAEQGDIAVRSDINRSFILRQSPYSTLANWVELKTPTDTVLSVNGQTGAVTITSITGNAGTATTLQTARTIATSGAAIGTATSFNGSSNITIPITSLNAPDLTGYVPVASLPVVSTLVNGAMIASDKTKLDGIAIGATANVKTTITPLMNGTAAIGTDTGYAVGNHVHPTDTSRASTAVAQISINGLMSGDDKRKLDLIEERAQKNKIDFVSINGTRIIPTVKEDGNEVGLDIPSFENPTFTGNATVTGNLQVGVPYGDNEIKLSQALTIIGRADDQVDIKCADEINLYGTRLNFRMTDGKDIFYAHPDGLTLLETPTAPTAYAGTNTDQIATTKFVQTETSTKLTKPTGTPTQVLNGQGTPISTTASVINGGTLPFTSGGAYNLSQTKQDKLISGTNIVTINGVTLLNSGNIDIPRGVYNDGWINLGTWNTQYLNMVLTNVLDNIPIDLSRDVEISFVLISQNTGQILPPISIWYGANLSPAQDLSNALIISKSVWAPIWGAFVYALKGGAFENVNIMALYDFEYNISMDLHEYIEQTFGGDEITILGRVLSYDLP